MSVTEEGWIDLGHGCSYKFYGPADAPSGIWFRYPSSDPNWTHHTGRVPFSGQGAWTVNTLDPLDISPSILTASPPDEVHGFIRNGRWEPC